MTHPLVVSSILFVHHTKEKGDLGVLKAQLDLFEQGFLILNPVTEHAPFDLVAYKDWQFQRVQVKYKSVDKTGSITVHFRSCWADKNGTHMQQTDKDVVIFIVFIALILMRVITLIQRITIAQLR